MNRYTVGECSYFVEPASHPWVCGIVGLAGGNVTVKTPRYKDILFRDNFCFFEVWRVPGALSRSHEIFVLLSCLVRFLDCTVLRSRVFRVDLVYLMSYNISKSG